MGNYSEAQVRQEFINPFFFILLKWNIDNEQRFEGLSKDVVYEDAIKIGETTKAPDYPLRILGTRKFFLGV